MKPLRVLVDADGVMADMAPRFLQALFRLTGKLHPVSAWTDWHPSKAGICTNEQAAFIFDALGPSVDLLPDVPGSREGVDALRHAGHRCVALTSPVITPGWLHGRVKWLHSRGFGSEDIVLAWDKALVPGDVMIDDNADFANAWAEAHPSRYACVFHAPWNQDKALRSNVYRVHGWAGVLEAVGLDAASKPGHSDDCFGHPCIRGEICGG